MLSAQAIYGPHSEAQWGDGDVSLGRRLFRLLPEDVHDRGPIALPDGAVLTADVRLDNREDLCSALAIEPARARLLSDAAVLAAVWLRWREEGFARLSGDWALAVWDPQAQALTLARDPFGHRPLHYHYASGLAAFASMPLGLHALAAIPVEPEEIRLAAFLALRPETGPATFFAGVQRVEPGAVTRITRQGLRCWTHYAPPRRMLTLSGPAAYAEALREQLDRSVAARLRGAGGQVGSHLSSGWDSPAVTATAARLLAPEGGRVVAFTAAPRPGYLGAAPPRRHGDESSGAAAVAALYPNIDHVILRGAARSPLADLDRDHALGGRPVLNPCNQVWINDINRAAQSRGVRVMLTGDLGNIGLTDDGQASLPDLAAAGRWLTWLALARAARRSGTLTWPGVLAASFPHALPAEAWRRLRLLFRSPFSDVQHYSALRPERLAALPTPEAPLGSRWERALETLWRMDLALSHKASLAAYGVDIRDPLTDRGLIEFCLSVPIRQLIADGRLRALARRALADRLPPELLAMPTRGYQAVDWHEGLTADRATLAADLDRLAATPMVARLMDIDALRALAARWPDRDWIDPSTEDAYRRRLLRGVAVGRFITRALGVNG
jgi:asparagine synthase (glutamine-hydrolysing)